MHRNETNDLDLLLVGLVMVAIAGFLAAGYALWLN